MKKIRTSYFYLNLTVVSRFCYFWSCFYCIYCIEIIYYFFPINKIVLIFKSINYFLCYKRIILILIGQFLYWKTFTFPLNISYFRVPKILFQLWAILNACKTLFVTNIKCFKIIFFIIFIMFKSWLQNLMITFKILSKYFPILIWPNKNRR